MKVKLKKIATVQMGYSFRSRLEFMGAGELAVIQMKDLLDENIVDSRNFTKIDMKAVKDHHLAQKGDLVFRSRGLVNTSAIIVDDPGNAVVAAPLLRIRITKPDLILPEYLNRYISQRDAQVFFNSSAKGTVQKMISKQAIEDLDISLPSLEKQKAVLDMVALTTREQTLLRTLAEKRAQYISSILMKYLEGE
jgi:restriction endonuclease S subunit